MQIAASFPRYRDHDPMVPVYCLTPDLPGAIHRFYDTSPLSPSGRYLAVTQLPDESRLPAPGEVARIIVVDLASGEQRVVAETRGWDTQLGAQLQWGDDDRSLYFNDLDTVNWLPYGVRLDPTSGRAERLQQTVYMVSGDGRRIVSPCLRRIARTQPGYGVVVPPQAIPRNHGASSEDGIYLTDADSGVSRLLVSIAELVARATPRLPPRRYARGDFYLFHVKWNPRGDRLMAILRWQPHGEGGLDWIPWRFGRRHWQDRFGRLRRDMILTLHADGSHIRLALPDRAWLRGGHHPNWCPDGERILMNLDLHGEQTLRFVLVDHDGDRLHALGHDLVGSGHPTLHPDGRHILTDAYPHEPMAAGDGSSPIRWIDGQTGAERVLLRIPASPGYRGPRNELRVDPHPAWDRTFRRIVFNGCGSDGRRRVFLAELGELLDG